jgi:uncharacterized DUF497 family protein
MPIVWDEPKRLSNLDKHQLDFRDLTPGFFEDATVFPTYDGRLAAIGQLADRTLTVIYFELGTEALSIISMRYASPKERMRLYEL